MKRLREVVQRAFPRLVYWRRFLRAGGLRSMSAADVFTAAYRDNAWSDPESRSGPGSTVDRTAVIRERLPALLRELGVRTMLDIPCGDFNWMSHVPLDLERYIGADIVEAMIEVNRQGSGGPARTFERLNLLEDDLPRVDLILCRDCLVHFSYRDIERALGQIRRSGSTWLLTTTFTREAPNTNIVTGQWRPLNLCRKPFDFPPPRAIIGEGDGAEEGAFADKSLGLWRVEEL